MDRDYMLNEALKMWAEYIEPGSKEKEVQAFWENLLWTVYTAANGFSTVTKYAQRATEPDDRVMHIKHHLAGPSSMDLLIVELKRPAENVTRKAFDKVADRQLDNHMAQSDNPNGTTLFGAVGIGLHVQFYSKVLPNGARIGLHEEPFHLLNDSRLGQAWFEYFKDNIPRVPQPPVRIESAPETERGGSPDGETGLNEGVEAQAVSPTTANANLNIFPDSYFYVQGGRYFHLTVGGSITTLDESPKNAWVLNQHGWRDTDRTKKWRWAGSGGTLYQ